MEILKVEFDFDTAEDKYKYIYANDTEEIRNYRNSRKSFKVKGNFNEINSAFEKAALREFEKELVKASKGKLTITD